MKGRRARGAGRRPERAPLHAWYRALLRAYGPQGWWPGRTRFEVIAGAFLTQNTAWSNVEKGLRSLRRAGLLHPGRMHRAGPGVTAPLLRPTGYFNQKAKRLHAFLDFLVAEHGGRLDRLFALPLPNLRERLLRLEGVGPETADSIILYAGRRPVFVIDAYTRRILKRHGHLHPHETYEDLRRRFEAALPSEVPLYNEYHALIVRLAKDRCRSRIPDCRGCPLERFLPPSGPRRD